MQIRFKKILAREFKYNGSDKVIESEKILSALIEATGKSNYYIQENPEEFLEGIPLQEFNKLLKDLKNEKIS